MREENGEEMESISPSYISPERDQRTHDKDISNNFTNFNKKNSVKQCLGSIFTSEAQFYDLDLYP